MNYSLASSIQWRLILPTLGELENLSFLIEIIY